MRKVEEKLIFIIKKITIVRRYFVSSKANLHFKSVTGICQKRMKTHRAVFGGSNSRENEVGGKKFLECGPNKIVTPGLI